MPKMVEKVKKCIVYACEVCREEFDKVENADTCELEHKQCEKIKVGQKVKYTYYITAGEQGQAYPSTWQEIGDGRVERIDVTMKRALIEDEDGSRQWVMVRRLQSSNE